MFPGERRTSEVNVLDGGAITAAAAASGAASAAFDSIHRTRKEKSRIDLDQC